MMRNLKHYSSKGAFTLVELIVATAVMLMVTVLVIQMTNGALNVWNRSFRKLALNAEARIAMDQLTQDLQGVVFRDTDKKGNWMLIDRGRRNWENSKLPWVASLYFYSSVLDRPTDTAGTDISGAICAVAYRVEMKVDDNALNTPLSYVLYRKVFDSKTTFEEMLLKDQFNANVFDTIWPSSEITKEENYLAGNVIGFKVTVTNPSNINEKKVTRDDSHSLNADGPLSYAEIHLTVLSDRGMELFFEILQGENLEYKTVSELVAVHGEVFIRGVPLISSENLYF